MFIARPNSLECLPPGEGLIYVQPWPVGAVLSQGGWHVYKYDLTGAGHL